MQFTDNPYQADWKTIDSLESQGLLRSALDNTDKLYQRAKRERNPAQVIKSLLYRAKFQSGLEEDGQVVAIAGLEAELKNAGFPEKAIMQSVLAELYRGYLQSNYWRFGDRTDTPDYKSDDVRTWSVAQLIAHCAALYEASLSDERLAAVRLSDFSAITMPGVNVEALWPTLFDMLAHRAIDYFSDQTSYLTSPVYKFYIDKESAFANAADFVKEKYTTRDTSSFQFKTLLLFQKVLARHLNDADPAALIDADLKRLRFVFGNSAIDIKDKLYFQALERLRVRFADYPPVTEVMHAMANWHFEKGNQYSPGENETYQMSLKEAKTLCEEAIKKFPKSYGAQHCRVLLESILSKRMDIQAESVNLPDQPALLRIDFKNITKVYVKVVKLDAKDQEDLEFREFENMLSVLNRRRPVNKAAMVSLPDTKDYQQHSTEWALPALPMGWYAVLASDNDDFSVKSGRVSILFTQYSFIGPMRQQNARGEMTFAVAHRKLGSPMAGVKAKFFKPQYDNRRRRVDYVKAGESVSDKNGMIKPPLKSDQFRVEFSFGPDVLFPSENFYSYSSDYQPQGEVLTHFFLDRAIYRPGQTLYFKGIVLQKNAQGIPTVMTNEKVTVTLLDANYQEVSKLDLVTNSYGTVQGSFTTPTGGLLGLMSLRSSVGNSTQGFQVEEYKRPRFEVNMKGLEGNFQLGDKVTAKGEAQALAGSAVDGAKVQYRVVRQMRYPWRPWGYGKMIYPPYGSQESMEIANGELKTDAEGKFSIVFEAAPDRTAERKHDPSFIFTVFVDITDITGETRSVSRAYNLGYVGLEAQLKAPEFIEQAQAVPFGLVTQNLDGEAQAAKGRIEIYRLKAPRQAYLKRYWAKPDQWIIAENDFHKQFPFLAYRNEDEPQSWAHELQVLAQTFDTGKEDSLKVDMAAWPLGQYLVVLKTQDDAGHPIEAQHFFTLIGPQGKALPPHVDLWLQQPHATYEPGTKAALNMAAAGLREVYFQLERQGEIISSGWMNINAWAEWSHLVAEEDRGNLQLNLFSVKNNRALAWSNTLVVPWSNKELKITYATFRDKLRPGQAEEWRLQLSGPGGERIAAEMVAAMYDASLDQIIPHQWSFSPFPVSYYSPMGWGALLFDSKEGSAYEYPRKGGPEIPYRAYPMLNWFGFYPGGGYFRGQYKKMMPAGAQRDGVVAETMENVQSAMPPPPPRPESAGAMMDSVLLYDPENPIAEEKPVGPPTAPPAPPQVQVRKNLQETTFFFPQLNTDAQGNVIIRFNAGESLTRWKFLALAHTPDLKYALSQREVVTQKELMVLPNAPRFVRENDEFWFTAKVSNLTQQTMNGQIRLELYDAATMQPVGPAFGLENPDLSFTALAGQSAPATWRLRIPVAQAQGLTWRVIATAGSFSDGEENTLPVLTNRMLVTETLPLPVKGKSTETFHFEAMKRAGTSSSLKHHRFTLEYTSNPAWYAVQALPYLMEYPYECTEQIFNRYYANALASSVANRYPKIKEVFERWKNTPALESNLSKNQDLKTALLEETPWVLEAQAESQQKKQIGLLFDLVKMGEERALALKKLAERQSPAGGLPWFPGGQDNWYITQLTLEGLGHLDQLGVEDFDKEPAVKTLISRAFVYVDEQLKKQYLELEKAVKKGQTKWEDDHLDHLTAHYLYTASFFPKVDHEKSMKPIIDYYLDQAEKHWTRKDNYQQGMLALALHRSKRAEPAQRIVRSLKERALHHPELGMYWKSENGYFWYQLPIETQALMVELFADVAKDDKSVEELKIWLLKNKQTNHWKTTKATAAAVYALLANGDNWLLENQAATISFPDLKKGAYEAQIKAAQQTAEAGTGYFSVSWDGNAISDKFSEVKVKNPNKSIAWGAIYWQYFEDLDKIKTFEETPLQLRKQLFKEESSDTGPVLLAVDKVELKPGDKLVVRLELRVDRDMEYVHLKDLRASGTEPINVLSQYKWQGGLGYYESTRDAGTHFFMDYLPRGTYVFEYPLRISHKGNFSNGITTIQCMYAPEFSSHSEGVRITVK